MLSNKRCTHCIQSACTHSAATSLQNHCPLESSGYCHRSFNPLSYFLIAVLYLAKKKRVLLLTIYTTYTLCWRPKRLEELWRFVYGLITIYIGDTGLTGLTNEQNISRSYRVESSDIITSYWSAISCLCVFTTVMLLGNVLIRFM